ncbi:globin-like protein [Nitzschia inconspicua]|uniref:Globin-like protein n=1 Tax=Nitzschia inconspicua TaxID=303405 RepID=A0A9K3LRN7_9STRA|nr:globin-like protein [Nitzschia inconspicua]
MKVSSLSSRKNADPVGIQELVHTKVSEPMPKIDCTKEIAEDIDYHMVSTVINSWDRKILNIPDWSRVVGDRFLRHIFRVDPKTIPIFGFPSETKWDDPSLSHDKNFIQKANKLIRAIDMAVVFLGPDLEPLKDELYRLGWQHTAMKALPSHWPIVGEALLSSLNDCMQGGFSDDERRGWVKIYNFMGFHMIRGLTAHYIEKGEAWRVDNSVKPPTKKVDKPVLAESIPIIAKEKEGNCPHRALICKQLRRSTPYQHMLQCNKRISAADVSFSVVSDVIASWQRIASTPNWEKTVGDLFLRYIFKIEPAAIELFGFPLDTDYTDPDLTANTKFLNKGVVLIKAIDAAVHLLGPDLYPLEEVLYDLGKRHVFMKAQPEFWPVVGEALFLVFEERLGDYFDEQIKDAWTIMYNFLGYHMIQGLVYQYNEIEKRR